VRDHLATVAGWGKDGLLFPAANGGHLVSIFSYWDQARKVAARPDLRFHDLRRAGPLAATQREGGPGRRTWLMFGDDSPS
jgi:hypothetical protein